MLSNRFSDFNWCFCKYSYNEEGFQANKQFWIKDLSFPAQRAQMSKDFPEKIQVGGSSLKHLKLAYFSPN